MGGLLCDIGILVLISLASGELIYKCKDETTSIPIYASLKWTENKSMHNSTLVNIGFSRKIFDYCDISKYTKVCEII